MDDKKLNNILNHYKLTTNEKRELVNVIYPIFKHPEFQRRMIEEFKHHGNITLGEHIIEVTVMTFLLAKQKKRENFHLDLALRIALLHDLYTIPWQNNKDAKVHHFFNKHGFRHPLEAVINAINWFPEIFTLEEDKEIIIDGIIHHMYPLPVVVFKDTALNEMELKNFNLLEYLTENDKNIIKKSSNRKKIGRISITRSLYPEGKLVLKADKKVSFKQINNFSSALALITGKNSSLKK